ncbi:MAG: hypothetical protein K9K32_00070 [Halanaerobiales bacterium]|nr:hypothetical protein [Halanaerobiales bacterium]
MEFLQLIAKSVDKFSENLYIFKDKKIEGNDLADDRFVIGTSKLMYETKDYDKAEELISKISSYKSVIRQFDRLENYYSLESVFYKLQKGKFFVLKFKTKYQDISADIKDISNGINNKRKYFPSNTQIETKAIDTDLFWYSKYLKKYTQVVITKDNIPTIIDPLYMEIFKKAGGLYSTNMKDTLISKDQNVIAVPELSDDQYNFDCISKDGYYYITKK